MSKGLKLLVVGGVPNEKYHCIYGGATVLMKNFLNYLNQNNFAYKFVQTNKFVDARTLELKPLQNKIYFLFTFLLYLPWCNIVMFNFSDHGVINFFPKLSALARLLGKKVVLRKFGGSFDIYLNKVSEKKKKNSLDALKKADLILFETKAGIEHLKTLLGNNINIQWFPNVRDKAKFRKNINEFNHKIVFMSHVSDEKGMRDLLSLADKYRNIYQFDIYGAIKEDKYKNFDWAKYGVNYYGQITSEQVMHKLLDYDILILPSYREGYPGIIIEALSVGIPVISTTVGGIPEVIEDGKSGCLYTAGNFNEMSDALLKITAKNYKMFSDNAYKTFQDNFESNHVNELIIDSIINI